MSRIKANLTEVTDPVFVGRHYLRIPIAVKCKLGEQWATVSTRFACLRCKAEINYNTTPDLHKQKPSCTQCGGPLKLWKPLCAWREGRQPFSSERSTRLPTLTSNLKDMP